MSATRRHLLLLAAGLSTGLGVPAQGTATPTIGAPRVEVRILRE